MQLPRIALTALIALAGCSHAEIGDDDLAPEPRAAATTPSATAASDVEAIYMLKQFGPDQYAVDLSGGMSEVRSPFAGRAGPDKKATLRTVTGQVVDAEGRPVAGAVLLAGEHVRALLGTSMTATHGTTTDAEGRYTLPLTTEEPVVLLAMANENAWSSLHDIAAGTEDMQLEVGLGLPAHLVGSLERAGERVQPVAMVRERNDRPRFMLRIQGEPDGSYESPPLPPGEYVVGYAVDNGKPLVAGYVEERPVSLRAGQALTADVGFAGGTALELGYEGLEDDALRTVTYTLLAGQHSPDSPEALDVLRKSGDTKELSRVLVGGIDLRPPRVFPDIPAGEVTACLEARGMKDPEAVGRTDLMMAFECRTIELDPADIAREVAFQL